MDPVSKMELYSDLIKIGIPSLVTIVTAILAACLAIRSHRKDVYIERLRMASGNDREVKAKQGELIQRIVADLNEVHIPLLRYGTLVAEDITSDVKIPLLREMRQGSISDAFDELSRAAQEGHKAKINVHLLGNLEVTLGYEAYWQALLRFLNECSPDKDVSLDLIHVRHEAVKCKQEYILGLLSKIYLGQNK